MLRVFVRLVLYPLQLRFTNGSPARALQNRPDFLKAFSISRCQLDEDALALLWEGLHEQRSTIENLDVSHNSGRIEAAKAAETLADATRLRCLNLAYSIKGNLDGPLFRPWSATSNFEPWRLEEIDLSGWKVWYLRSLPYNLANEV